MSAANLVHAQEELKYGGTFWSFDEMNSVTRHEEG